jgi:hypothetical protein
MEDALVAQLKRAETKRGAPFPLRAGAALRSGRPVKAGWMHLQQIQQRLLVWVPLLCRARYDLNFVGFRDHREISGYERVLWRVFLDHHRVGCVAQLARFRL